MPYPEHQRFWGRVARERDALVRIYAKAAFIVIYNCTEFTSRAILKWAIDNSLGWYRIGPGNGSLRALRRCMD